MWAEGRVKPDGREGVFLSAVCFSQPSAGEKVPGRPSWSDRGDPGKDLEDGADSPHGCVTASVKHKAEKPAGRCLPRGNAPHFPGVEADTGGKCLPQTLTPSKNTSFSKNNTHH